MHAFLSAFLGFCVVVIAWVVLTVYLQRAALYKGQQGLFTNLGMRFRLEYYNGVESIWYAAHKQPLEGQAPVSKKERLEVESLFLPADRQPRPCILYAHGNANTIHRAHSMNGVRHYHRMGFHVAMVEYRGYSKSPGPPNIADITSDHVKAVDLLRKCALVKDGELHYHGYSLGGGVVASLSRFRAPASMVLESTFASTMRIAEEIGLPSFLMCERYDTETTLRRYCTWPLLIYHGTLDTVIPVTHAFKNYLAAQSCHASNNKTNNGVQMIITHRRHRNEPDGCVFWGCIQQFFKNHVTAMQ